MMPKCKADTARDDRIGNEVVVDAYGPEERAMSWFYYLEDRIVFPFWARCSKQAETSPLQKGEQGEVLKVASADACENALVMIRCQGRKLAVPLEQLEPVEVDDATAEAVGDWNYWIRSGNLF